jgi:hypothetical protein
MTDYSALVAELEGFAEGSTSARATLMRDAAAAIRTLTTPPTDDEPTGRMVNNGDYTHLQTHRRRKVGPWEPVEAARDAS